MSSCTGGQGRNIGICNLRLPYSEAFVRTEKKQLVFNNWAAKHAAKVILAQRGFLQTFVVKEPVVRIQHVIAEIFKCRAMKFVGAGFCDDRDLRAGSAPGFQAALNQLPNRPEKACEVLESALISADQAIAVGRNAIQQLRTGTFKESNLEQMLLATGREFASPQNGEDGAPPLRLIVEGNRRAKRAMLREEIYRIAQELLRNAYRHARAQKH